MKSIGNLASNAKYNPNETRHPPPANREESERDSELEKFIRWKYEFRRFMDKTGSKDAPSAKAPTIRPQSTPVATIARRSSPLPPLPSSTVSNITAPPRPSGVYSATTIPPAPSLRQPSAPSLAPPSMVRPAPAAPLAPQPAPNPVPHHPVWDDMMSLANPGQSMPSMLPQSQLQVPSQFQQPSFPSSSSSTSTLGTTSTHAFPSTVASQPPGRSASLPVLTSPSNPFPTQSTHPQPSIGDHFAQQLPGYPGQMPVNTHSFQSSPSAPVHVQSPFQQLSSTHFSHSYAPPLAPPYPQQQQQFTPTSFPQQFVQTSHIPMQQPLQAFPQQQPMQGGNPFGVPAWQHQPSGQPQHGPWGGM
ncbi:hypothetical protein JB92DRAFT_3026001 [Gautieria morchelliformis]|nr:hypothetical protein JB92DRAFT_3026001 [Gautieria morchelliformis]